MIFMARQRLCIEPQLWRRSSKVWEIGNEVLQNRDRFAAYIHELDARGRARPRPPRMRPVDLLYRSLALCRTIKPCTAQQMRCLLRKAKQTCYCCCCPRASTMSNLLLSVCFLGAVLSIPAGRYNHVYRISRAYSLQIHVQDSKLRLSRYAPCAHQCRYLQFARAAAGFHWRQLHCTWRLLPEAAVLPRSQRSCPDLQSAGTAGRSDLQLDLWLQRRMLHTGKVDSDSEKAGFAVHGLGFPYLHCDWPRRLHGECHRWS